MRREDISDALDMLDEEMLAHTDLIRRHAGKTKSGRTKTGVRQNKNRRQAEQKQASGRKTFDWKKWGVMAAGLCLVCLAAIAVITVSWRNSAEDFPYQGKFAISRGHGGTTAEDGLAGLPDSKDAQDSPKKKSEDISPELQEPFVPISYLLASTDSNPGAIKELAAAYARIPIGEYTGIYEKVYSIDSAVLADSIGREVDGAKDWYYVSGHLDLQYLIRKENQDYSLWQFHYFNSDEYPYSDVLKLVYRIDSADAIAEIEVQPATMDNSDGGKRIQQEIGLRTITKQDEIETIYQVLCTMTCYGSNRWDLIDYGDAEAAVDAEIDHMAVWLGRYLTLALDNGNTIDGLKYTAVSNMFYEFSGVAYNPLTKEQAESVREILGITTKGELEEFNLRTPKPLEQDQNQEEKALLYQAENTNASLEYVTELQTKVSNAMINHELPFVIVSAVYENPYRLHVVVTTDSEDELEKLKSLDTEGGVLEIEYATGGINELRIEKQSSIN